MRLLICAGGTGGGVYPALAVLDELTNDERRMTNDDRRMTEVGDPSSFVGRPSSILWVGSVGGMEAELVERAGVPFTSIPAAGVHGVGWRVLPGNLLRLGQGFLAARRLLRQRRPDVLFFTGGYVAVPMAIAARSLVRSARPRSLLYVPDIEPGLALKTLAPFADCIAVTVEDSRAYFPPAHQHKIAVTGYPLRPELKAWEKDAARPALGVSPGLPTLLVAGGSSGCRSINQALLAALPELLVEMQIIHLAGKLDWPEVEAARSGLNAEQAARYHAYPYLHSEMMGAAFTVADLALARAGASVLGEFPFFGLPAVLVPYPYAWRYQSLNAEYLAKRGAALVVKDDELAVQISPVIQGLIRNPGRLGQMRAAMQALARPEAAQAIADLLSTLPDGAAPSVGGEK